MIRLNFNKPQNNKKFLYILIPTLLLLNACAVGPDFQSPQGNFIGENAPKFRKNINNEKVENKITFGEQEGNSKWWQEFKSPVINKWVEKALSKSPSAKMAYSALTQAGAIAEKSTAGLYPDINIKAGASRQKTAEKPLNDNSATTIYSVYNSSVNVSYVFDIFGGVRRADEYYTAAVETQKWESIGALNTLAGAVVNSIINLALVDEQIKLQNRIITIQKEQLEKVEKQKEIGAVSEFEVINIKANYEATLSVLPTLIANKNNLENQLLTLCGEYPQDNIFENINLKELNIPQEIPLWIPSELVKRRADIRSAESSLHQAYANVGMAKAGYYPQIGIAGSITSQALSSANLFKTTLWSIAASITQSLFKGGETKAQEKSANAGLELAQAKYQKIILNAFSDVSNTIANFQANNSAFKNYTVALELSQKSFELTRKKFEIGTSSVFDLINAEKNYLSAQMSQNKYLAQKFIDVSSLYIAAGGSVELN